MAFGIQLLFDPESDATLRRLWDVEAEAGLPFPLRDSGNSPHISPAIYDQLDIPGSTALLEALTQTFSLFPLTFSSLGIFPGEKTVIFLAPATNVHLFALHNQLHQVLPRVASSPHIFTLPSHWTPHCTLAKWVPSDLLAQSVTSGLSQPLPLTVAATAIGLVEYPPAQRLATFSFLGV